MSEPTKSTQPSIEVDAGQAKPHYEPPAVVELSNASRGEGIADCFNGSLAAAICDYGGLDQEF